jgi:hypothetical protein
MREENVGPDPLVENGAAWWVPAVRAAYQEKLKCFGSPLPEDSVPGAKVWEARMQQANRIAAGNVSVLGGGAWANKQGSLACEADQWAWDRLRTMQREAERATS